MKDKDEWSFLREPSEGCDFFGEVKEEMQEVEESDEGAKKSSLYLISLCKKHKVNSKIAMDLLNHAENELQRELGENEIAMAFKFWKDNGKFRSVRRAPNDWDSRSPLDKIDGSPYSSGSEEEFL